MKVSNDIYYVGVNDHEVDLFEGQYLVPNGMSYNSYLILDDKIAVMDTVDINFANKWLENIHEALNDKIPDYLIIQHMEPDHSACIMEFLKKYPNVIVVGNRTTFTMIKQFFNTDVINKLEITNGYCLTLGKHSLSFVFAPMVHWPEVMVTYDNFEKALFSADAFGKFGALDVEEKWIDEARRYYIGIVGKFGMQVQTLLKKASVLDIQKIYPLHGPIIKDNIAYYLNLYNIWSSYQIEEEGVVLAYSSIYGNTKKAINILEKKLKEKGLKNIVSYDLARDDISHAVADSFRFSTLVLATPTYNGTVFPHMNTFINHLVERNFQKRSVALIENGSWAPLAAKVMKEKLSGCKDINFIEPIITIKSSLDEKNINEINDLANNLCIK